MNSRFRLLSIILLAGLPGLGQEQAYAYGNDFSCPIGARGACLSFGDSVCSSSGKCVEQSAKCFSSSTCGFSNDFVCKSDFDDLATSCRRLESAYQDLSSNNDRLRDACTDLQSDYNTLVDEHESLRQRHSDLPLCLATSSEAASCIR